MKANNSKSNKVYNRNSILKMITLDAPISRIELASRSGLSKMSLTNIISEFKEEGLVEETGVDVSAAGKRKPILLELVDGALCSIGIHITRNFVEGCLADIKGTILFSKKEPLSKDITTKSLTEIILNLIRTIHNLESRRIVGIGVSSMGPLDLEKGVILNPTNFYGIQNLPIVSIIKEKYPNLPVFLCKNTSSAVLAEKYYGTDKAIKNFAYLGVSNTLGCGAVVDDRLITGSNGFACELGHISVNPDGPLCSCGNKGCLEIYASLNAAEQYAEEEIKLGEETMLTSPVLYEDIVSAAKAHDKVACRVLDKQCKYLSVAVINLINTFDPSVVVVGNEIAIDGKEIIDRIRNQVANIPLSAKHHPVDIVLSKFYDKAPLLGSATYVFEMLYFC